MPQSTRFSLRQGTSAACVSAGKLAAFISHALAADEVAVIEDHLALCTDCRTALAAVRSQSTAVACSAEQGLDVGALDENAQIDRYVLGPLLGYGGMGVVYAARDPALNRDVALKVLRNRAGQEAVQTIAARMRREAQAMASLSHPNVVTVFDVGSSEDRVWIAMEKVEGGTLREWLKVRRTWREIVAIFLQAGRGLAAAHEAGIVHRDFKPENVLVGKDGRARVGDFGLARLSVPEEAHDRGAALASLGTTVSREGVLAGTPAYMAPDQLRGARGNEQSDQFSFCVALYEALYGARPFDGATVFALLQTMASGRLRSPSPGSSAPRWIRAILARGLRAKPEERYPSMRALLSALETDPNRRRRRRVAAGVALGALATVVAGFARSRHDEAVACASLERRLDGAWDAERKEKVHDAFAATGRPYAEDTFARVTAVLDAYAGRWARAVVGQCEAQRRAPRTAISALRGECMDQRLGELRALASVLAHADETTVDHAVQGARALPELDSCAGQDPMHGRTWPDDPALATQARSLSVQLDVAEATRRAGRYSDALALAEKNAAESEQLGFAPLVAEATLAMAELEREAGEVAASEKTFGRATLAAERAGNMRVAALAWMGAAARASEHGDTALAEERFAHAEAWVDRLGDDALRARLRLSHARSWSDMGKYDDARRLAAEALAIFQRLGDDASAIEATNVLGICADIQGRYAEARDDYERVLEWYERVLGPDHPLLARPLNDRAELEFDQGRSDAAIPLLERALAILDRAFGPEHQNSSYVVSNLANAKSATDHFAEALPLAERALRIDERVFGRDSPDAAYSLSSVCMALDGLGRWSDAIAYAERELAIRQRGAPAAALADAQADLGLALVRSKRDVGRGRPLLVEARATFVHLGRMSRVPHIDRVLAEAK
jgi:serine/threonine-protein kinase